CFPGFQTCVDQARTAAEEFVHIDCEIMDKRRRVLTRLFLGKATSVWRGNAASGQEALDEFPEVLLPGESRVGVSDCQPVHQEATQSRASALVVTCGTAKPDGSKQRYFKQSFLLRAQAPGKPAWRTAS
ncbi:NXT2 protein, partial [Casuarius casuarius]|nr:NXT2 protein [Casuarius casuarius]